MFGLTAVLSSKQLLGRRILPNSTELTVAFKPCIRCRNKFWNYRPQYVYRRGASRRL